MDECWIAESRLFSVVLSRCFTWNVSLLSAEYGSLFRSWENLFTLTSGKSERINHLACFSLLTKTSHVWGRWISFMEEWFHVKHDRMVELQEIAFRVHCFSPIGCWGLVFHVKREGCWNWGNLFGCVCGILRLRCVWQLERSIDVSRETLIAGIVGRVRCVSQTAIFSFPFVIL